MYKISYKSIKFNKILKLKNKLIEKFRKFKKI